MTNSCGNFRSPDFLFLELGQFFHWKKQNSVNAAPRATSPPKGTSVMTQDFMRSSLDSWHGFQIKPWHRRKSPVFIAEIPWIEIGRNIYPLVMTNIAMENHHF
jgi:hypothetical protein